MRATLSLIVLLAAACNANAQQMINTTVPFQQLGSSFFENTGVTWSLSGPNFFANSGNAVVPPFGNFDPNSGLRTGIAFGNGKTRGTLGFTFGQGSSRSITSTAPSITTMNGVPGSITSQTIRPFVTGITPVVSDYPTFGTIPGHAQQMSQAIQHAQQSDLQRSMAAANKAQQNRALAYFNRGQRADAEGDKRMARANYRRALGLAQGLLRLEVLKRMQANGWAP